ncbi:uncharacterized protein LOC141676617 [Apium graveolens]|uniref:uncharacterized protein LOC141676617 n=1 Tax=Apium graveolens TaxID=4045 RepID=UPI003D7C0F97
MHFLDKPADSIDLLRDFDQLVAYRLPKDNNDSSYLVVFMHQHEYKPIFAAWFEKMGSGGSGFGTFLKVIVSNIDVLAGPLVISSAIT